ncbi:MAG TPA: TetR/AcrR family transcriptional regulator [Anaerolineae bacterium]|nr:TetR/AcrR family transcriptional regulator [Anaerolineae bacterium]
MTQPLSRRERKKRETRQALLEAALALFREKGYDAATVEEITARADVAKGTFFNYFPSKEALLGELTAWQLAQLREAVDVARGAPASPVARIRLLMRLLRERMRHDWRLYQRAFASRWGRSSPHHQARNPIAALLADLVREAQAVGEIRADVEAELVGDLILMAHIRRLAVSFHRGEEPPPDDGGQVMEVLMEGLAGPSWTEK